MEARDKNYNLIQLGMYVNVPEPREGFEDCWNNAFLGYVLKKEEGGYVVIEDAEGDCFTIESELLEIAD